MRDSGSTYENEDILRFEKDSLLIHSVCFLMRRDKKEENENTCSIPPLPDAWIVAYAVAFRRKKKATSYCV